MTRHTPETVRAADRYHANELRAEHMTEDEAARVSLSTTLGTATFAIDSKLPRYLSFTTSDGKHVDRVPLDRIAELEEQVRVLREALEEAEAIRVAAAGIAPLMEAARQGGPIADVNRAQSALYWHLRDLCDLVTPPANGIG